jgi:hypothetical protein
MLVYQVGDAAPGRASLPGQSPAHWALSDGCNATAATRCPLGDARSIGTTGEILVVDDDAGMRGLVAKVLAREGYSVRALPRARDVLQTLEEGSADLVVSDIRMPEVDGLTLLLHQETVRLMPGAAPLVEGRGDGAGAPRRAVGVVWLAQACRPPVPPERRPAGWMPVGASLSAAGPRPPPS